MEFEQEWDDMTLALELLVDVRAKVVRVLQILEEDDEEEEQGDA